MKKTFKFFAAALAIVAAASCAKEVNVDTSVENPSTETIHMTFSASHETDNDTKSFLSSDRNVHWSDDDAIRVYYKEGEYLRLNSSIFNIDPASNDTDPTFADFSGDIVPSSNYYAVGTSAGWSVAKGATMDYIAYEGLLNQTAVKGSYDPKKHLALSVSTKDNHFYFQNACSLLKVTIGSDNVYSVKITGEIVKVGSGPYEEGALGGEIWFKPGFVEPYRIINSVNQNTITLRNADSNVALEKGAVYFIVVPQCAINNFTVTICNENGDAIGTKSKSSQFNILRNKVYDLGLLEKGKPTYKIKNPNQAVQYAGDLQDGKQYMIFYSSKYNHVNEESYCWTVDYNNGRVVRTSVPDKSKAFSEEYIFTFVKQQNIKFSSYSSATQGYLRAVGRDNKYFKNLNFTETDQYNATSLIFANHWTGESQTRCDIDIWNSSNTSATLWNDNGYLEWGTNTDSPRKFFIYEVELSN